MTAADQIQKVIGNGHQLYARRLANWCQTTLTRIVDSAAAVPFIDRVGVATLFPASPEMPNLYHAHTGDPNASVVSEWDSPAGQVYGWRWRIGRPEAAFYTAIVRNRPTWVSWDLLPAVIRLRGELRTPDELYDVGELSAGAYRIAQVLEEASCPLSTGALRQRAGFPTGKAHRAAYLKAVEELDTRLLVAKVFEADDDAMSHALVAQRYPTAVAEAERISRTDALDAFLGAYLPCAVYARPDVLARHLRVAQAELIAGLERAVAAGRAESIALPGRSDACYVYTDV